MTGPHLRALIAEQRPGCCCICDAKLPRSRGDKPRTRLCRDPECQREYDRACWRDYGLKRRARMRTEGRAA